MSRSSAASGPTGSNGQLQAYTLPSFLASMRISGGSSSASGGRLSSQTTLVSSDSLPRLSEARNDSVGYSAFSPNGSSRVSKMAE